jgi:cytochrome c oxidase cbb3-type subunit 3/ubiquinol-cytochrome c reductase cytochrome c subunit
MKARLFAVTAIPAMAALLSFATGCDHLPGATHIETVERPDSITNFTTLYGQNCAGCHGTHGENGPAIDLANPVYQAWVDDATLNKIITNGEPGTQMPAFGKSAGGLLTEAQVDALVKGLRSTWQANGTLNGQNPPPYVAAEQGDATQGQKTYQIACARCHSQQSQQVTDPTYLALVSDQALRTLIVAGRPDLGHPDWRGDIPNRPLTGSEVSDIIAYLNSLRSQTPGQPYSHP